jgi:hypothetical protein
VFLCGNYFALAGRASPNLGAVFAGGGARDYGWKATTDGAVNACAVDETHLFVGGHFGKAGGTRASSTGQRRNHLAAFAGSNGALHNWNPGANSVPGVYGLGTSKYRVGIGGDFTRTGGANKEGFAQYSPT